uniref:Uncharacterized protein n=1 Tax=Salix viminalis TaxID=40686 RepID=A0A6N2LMQ6_SALVM
MIVRDYIYLHRPQHLHTLDHELQYLRKSIIHYGRLQQIALAPDSAAGNHSAAAKVGGVAGVILVLILVIIYLILRRGGCYMNCDVGVNEAPRRGAEKA